MKTPFTIPSVTAAVLTLAEIKAAVEAFDRGDSNVFDALDAVSVAIDAHRAVLDGELRRTDQRRDAA